MRQAVDGVTLGYDMTGTGTPVVFLHAFPLNRQMWAGQVEALRGKAQTLTLDFRGYGESDQSPGPFGLEALADDVLALARRAGITRAVIVGLSMGGYVAFRLIERSPEFVQALALADTRAEPDTPEGRTNRRALADRVEREGMAAMQQFIQGLLGPTTRASRPGVVTQLLQLIGSPSPAAVAATLRAMADRPDSRPLLPEIRVPTLVLVGEEDGLTTPDSARVIANGIRGARLEIIPQAGHLSNLEARESFNQELLAFIREVA